MISTQKETKTNRKLEQRVMSGPILVQVLWQELTEEVIFKLKLKIHIECLWCLKSEDMSILKWGGWECQISREEKD